MQNKFLDLRGRMVRHFKGDLYLIEDVAIHSETEEALVIYRALYGECKLYARPYGMFFEEVPEDKINPTGQKFRFEFFKVSSIK